MCVICDRLAMRVVPVNFTGISEAERDVITQAIEEAYDGTDRRAYVIDALRDNYKMCPAYSERNGGQALVHFGHCYGAFDAVDKCPYYNEGGGYADEACRYRTSKR